MTIHTAVEGIPPLLLLVPSKINPNAAICIILSAKPERTCRRFSVFSYNAWASALRASMTLLSFKHIHGKCVLADPDQIFGPAGISLFIDKCLFDICRVFLFCCIYAVIAKVRTFTLTLVPSFIITVTTLLLLAVAVTFVPFFRTFFAPLPASVPVEFLRSVALK